MSEAGAQSTAAPRKKRVFSGIQPTGVFTLGQLCGGGAQLAQAAGRI